MYNIVSHYVELMSKDDIVNFAKKNNLNVSDYEIDFIYNFIKKNYSQVLKNPNSFDLSIYKDNFSNDNYIFLSNLVNKYKRMII